MTYKLLDSNNYNMNSLFNITTPLAAKVVKALDFNEKKLTFINDNYLKYIGNPFDFKYMDQATYLVKKSIINQEKILIYGDYESDGVYATTILSKVLDNFEAIHAYYIPNRYVDGKGLNPGVVKSIIRKGYKLVICLGNGFENFENIETLRNHGIEVVIIDNKYVNKYPAASAIINPGLTSRETSYFTTVSILTYKFVKALAGYHDDFSFSIAGLSLINSRLPLNEENYHMLKQSLYIFNNKKFSFLRLLSKNSQFINMDVLKEVDHKISDFTILSRANDVNKIPLLLNGSDKEDSLTFSKLINKYRKEFKHLLSSSFTELEYKKLNENLYFVDITDIDYNYYYPFMLNELEKNKRFVIGYNKNRNKLFYLANEYFGEKKAFLASEKVDINDIDSLYQYLKDLHKDTKIKELEYALIPIEISDLTIEGVKNFEHLGPFGINNEKPMFKISNFSKNHLSLSVNGLHIIGKIDEKLYFAAYEKGEKYQSLEDNFSIVVIPNLNYFDEKLSVSCTIIDFIKE